MPKRTPSPSDRTQAFEDADADDHRAEVLAKRFHELYEGFAPAYGYETRNESRKPWSGVPANNRRLMVAVCAQLLTEHDAAHQNGLSWPAP